MNRAETEREGRWTGSCPRVVPEGDDLAPVVDGRRNAQNQVWRERIVRVDEIG